MEDYSSAELHEALLQRPDEDDTSKERPHRVSQALIPYQPFNLQQFILGILFRCGSLLASCFKAVETSCLLALGVLGAPLQPRELSRSGRLSLSPIQEERLEQLWSSLGQPFQPDLPEHQEELRELWVYAFPGEPCTSLKKNERWKDMGWQGDDPSTDMRGAGLFGVQNLLYMARWHPSEFERLLHKRTGQRAEWEYPFAAAGMNLTFALADLLGMGHAGAPGSARGALPLDRMHKQPTFAGFVHMLGAEAHSFEELYVMAFRLLDERWLRDRASYMQFNAVLKGCMADLGAALKGRPASLELLCSRLKLPPMRVVPPSTPEELGQPAPPLRQPGTVAQAVKSDNHMDDFLS